jgi:hypothetical protein
VTARPTIGVVQIRSAEAFAAAHQPIEYHVVNLNRGCHQTVAHPLPVPPIAGGPGLGHPAQHSTHPNNGEKREKREQQRKEKGTGVQVCGSITGTCCNSARVPVRLAHGFNWLETICG